METPRLPVPRAERPVSTPPPRPLPAVPAGAVRAAALGGLAWTAFWLLRPAARRVLRRLLGQPDRVPVRVRRVTVVSWVEVWRQ